MFPFKKNKPKCDESAHLITQRAESPALVSDIHQLSTGANMCIGVMGFLRTKNEYVQTRQIFGQYDHDEPLSLVGALAMRGYDIHTTEFVEFFQGSYNGLPECSLFYRYVDGNHIEIKAVKRKDV